MPVVDRLITDLVLSRKLPFRSKGDAMRYCVVTGVKELLKVHDVPSVATHVDILNDTLLEELFQIQFREYFSNLQTVVEHYVAAAAEGQARRVVAHARARLQAMPDQTELQRYWKDRYLADLVTRYRPLLDAGGTGISFTDTEGETGA